VLAGAGATGASALGQGLAGSNLVMHNESPFDPADMSDDCAEQIANGHAFDEQLPNSEPALLRS
jgi:hypothetical protein